MTCSVGAFCFAINSVFILFVLHPGHLQIPGHNSRASIVCNADGTKDNENWIRKTNSAIAGTCLEA